MFASSHRLESDKWDLHWEDQTKDEEAGVGDVQPSWVASSEAEDKDVQWHQVNDEDVTTPRGDHVEIGQSAEYRPDEMPGSQSTKPEEVGEQKCKDGDAFIVIASGNWPADIAGN